MASVLKVPTEFTAVDKFTSVVSKMTAGVSDFSKGSSAAIDRFNAKANKISNTMAVAGGAIIAPLGLALNRAIEFEDKMADVAKTTGLTAKESEIYGNALLDMSKNTRTSIDQLQDIGVVAGTIGVAKDELVAFTKAGNEFAIALGSDFGSTEEAVTQVAKLKNLFKETRDIDIATSMTKAGSAINEVSNVAGSADNINNFMLRIGALPDAMKPTIQESAALGGFLEDAGLSAEIAAGGFSNLLLVAGKNMTGFAAQMGMSVKAANELYQTDPTQFAVKFAKSLSKLKPRELAMQMDQLKIGSQETIKVIGALGSGYEKFGNVLNTSNDAFKAGTSISDEAAKKNDTMAGKLAMAKNNMEALSITVGTQLAPVLDKIVPKVVNFVQSITDFINKNPELTTGIIYVSGLLLGLSFAIKGVILATKLYRLALIASNFAQGVFAFLTNASSVAIKAKSGYVFASTVATKSAAAAQWLWNAALAANPIGLIILAIIVLIALVVAAIAKWDEWGAAVLNFLGPIGWLINLIMTLRKHWDSIKQAFETEGIIGGFKRLGAVILDAVLYPLEQILTLMSKIPGVGKLLAPALGTLAAFRDKLGVNDVAPISSPEQNQAAISKNNGLNGNIGINVNDPGNVINDVMANFKGGIPVNLTTTQGAF